MKNKFYLLGCIVILLTSCSPKVFVNVTQSFPSVAVDSVKVFEMTDTIPNSSVALGTVSVVDGGFTTKCKYDMVLALAKQETAKAGGNGLLVVQHLMPGMQSSCHQIMGTMLRYNDTIVDANRPNPVMEAAINKLENIEKTEKAHRFPANVIRLNSGWSVLASDIVTPDNTYNNFGLLEYGVDYEHYWKSNIGFGLHLTYANANKEDKLGAKLFSFCPSLAAGYKTTKGWLWNTSLGLGYGILDCNYGSNRGLASQLRFGAGYMIAKHVSVGAQFQTLVIRFKAPSGWDVQKDGVYGVKRYGILVGLNYLF